MSGTLEQQDPEPRGSDASVRRAQPAGSIVTRALIAVVRLWQIGPSAVMGPTCRYDPSCSAYAIEALRRYGALKGGWLGLRRISRCHPFGGSGLDPVP